MPAQGRWRRVRDVFQRIGTAHIGRQAVVIEIQLFGFGIIDHILNDRSEFRGGCEDLWFCLCTEVDGFGITSAFKIEGAAIRPPMLVIANQHARGIC